MKWSNIIEKSTYFVGGIGIGLLIYHNMQPNDINVNTNIKSDENHLLRRDGNGRDFTKYGYPGPISDPIKRDAYIGSFNRQHRNPNFIMESLTEALLNSTEADREDSNFKEDTNIPLLFRGLLKDYSKSGYDRGHMAPAGDVKYSQSAMDETFFLTNMAPQVGIGFNRHYWAYLEAFCRNITKSFDTVYVITGPLYLPKKDNVLNKWIVNYEVIGNPPNIAVPTHFFKVLLGEKDNQPHLAAFVLPNQVINSDTPLLNFTTSIESVEKASGMIFFDKLGPNKEKENPKLCDKVNCKVSKFGV